MAAVGGLLGGGVVLALGSLGGAGVAARGLLGGAGVAAGGSLGGGTAARLLMPAARPAFTADSASTAGSFRCGGPGSCAGSVSPVSAYRIA